MTGAIAGSEGQQYLAARHPRTKKQWLYGSMAGGATPEGLRAGKARELVESWYRGIFKMQKRGAAQHAGVIYGRSGHQCGENRSRKPRNRPKITGRGPKNV